MVSKQLLYFFCLILFSLCPAFYASAQETPRETLGAGLEVNVVTLENAAGGFVFYYGWNLSPRFTLGLKIIGASDFREFNALEGLAFFRWNFLRQGSLPGTAFPRRVFFVQAGGGGGFYSFLDSPESKASFLGEAAAGLRFYVLPRRPLFIELFGRFAYPSWFGGGLMFGI
ncbi:MAG: hypothetical protein LBD09_01095 [Treponema sp.]|nr:hypothetical protein [Treponema sp.]